MRTVGRVHLGLFALLCLLGAAPLGAAPVARGILDNVRISVDGRTYECMLFPSQDDNAKWYCVLKSPYLLERMVDGKNVPELMVYRFQRPDPRNPNKLIESGVIDCSFVVAPPDSVLERLRVKVPAAGGRPIHIEPLPLSGVSMSFYSMQGTKMPAMASPTRAIAAADVVRTASFKVVLPTLDSGFIDVLVNSPTGVKFGLQYNAGLLDAPPAAARGAKEGDRSRATTSMGGSAAALPGRASSTGAAAAALPSRSGRGTTVLYSDRSNAGRGAGSAPTAARSAGLPGAGLRSSGSARDLVRSGGRATAPVAQAQAERDWQVFQRTNAQVRGWSCAVSGFLGLGRYPKEIRDSHNIAEDGQDGWRFSYLLLPDIPDIPGLPLASVGLDVVLILGGQEYGRWPFTWTRVRGWRDADGKAVRMAKIPLKNILAAGVDPLAEATFKIDKRVEIQKDDVFTDTETLPVRVGDVPLSSPTDLVELIKLDFGLINWFRPETDRTRLVKIEVRMREGKREVVRFIMAQKRNGYVEPPEPLQWLVPIGATGTPGRIQAMIFFHTADGVRHSWALNNKPEQQDFSYGLLMFSDDDWRPL